MEKPEQAGPLKKEMVSAVEEKEPKEKDAVKKPTPDMPEKKGEATTGETKPVAETQEQEKKMVATNQVAQDPKGETAEGTDGQALPPKLEMSDAEQQYQKISSLIVQGNYKQARLDLQGFVETYPHHTLTPSAYYWLGETYFIEKNYVEAAKTFLKGYKVNESSHKVNDILLKLAMSLGALDRKTEACKTYEKLRNSKIPLSATHKHIAEKEEKKLKCGA
jgi:tol-pal system protein YbgF